MRKAVVRSRTIVVPVFSHSVTRSRTCLPDSPLYPAGENCLSFTVACKIPGHPLPVATLPRKFSVATWSAAYNLLLVKAGCVEHQLVFFAGNLMLVRILMIAGIAGLSGCASQSQMHVVFRDGNQLFCQPRAGGAIVECDAPDDSQAAAPADPAPPQASPSSAPAAALSVAVSRSPAR